MDDIKINVNLIQKATTIMVLYDTSDDKNLNVETRKKLESVSEFLLILCDVASVEQVPKEVQERLWDIKRISDKKISTLKNLELV